MVDRAKEHITIDTHARTKSCILKLLYRNINNMKDQLNPTITISADEFIKLQRYQRSVDSQKKRYKTYYSKARDKRVEYQRGYEATKREIKRMMAINI
jgi:hypothetical protein